MSPRPSSGLPTPSITRPSNSGPTGKPLSCKIGVTLAPGITPVNCSLGIKNRVSPENPITSASNSPLIVSTLHKLPTGARQPTASSVNPTTRVKRPDATGRQAKP